MIWDGLLVAQGALGPVLVVDSVSKIFDVFKDGVSKVGGEVADGSMWILGPVVLLVVVKAWFESMLESDTVGFISTALEAVIIGTIALAVIQNYAEINAYVWEFCSGVMGLFDPTGSGGNTGSIIDRLWNSTVNSATSLLNFYQEKECEGGFVEKAACYTENFVDSFALFFVLLVVIILLLFYMAVMLLQVFRGIFTIGVGLIWLPFTASMYLLIDSWGKNALGVIMSGIAHMAMVSFLLGIVGEAAETLSSQAVTQGLGSIPGLTTVPYFSRSWAAMVLGIMICVLALSAGTAISKSAEIFGSVSGMVGLHRARPSGGGNKGNGGGNGAGSGAAGGAGGLDAGGAVGGGGQQGAGAKLAGQAASGVAQAGAAVATGGTSGIASGVAAAAKGAGAAMSAGAKGAAKSAASTARTAALAGNMAARSARMGGASAAGAAARGAAVAGAHVAGKAAAGAGRAAVGSVKIGAKAAIAGAKLAGRGATSTARVGAKMGMALARNQMRN